MFWKILGGIVAFFMVVVLAVTLLATASVAAVGVAVGSVVDNLDISTVQVTDANGNTETYDVNNLVSDSGRVEITDVNGERVTIDFNVPQITVQESSDDGAHVVIGSGSGLEVNPVSDSGRVEFTDDNGERVTIDFDVPQITVQERGEDAARVVIGGKSGLEIGADGSQIRIDGRNIDNFDGHSFVRPIVGFFRGLFTLAAWTLIAVGIWLVVRNRRPAANTPKEKTPDATA